MILPDLEQVLSRSGFKYGISFLHSPEGKSLGILRGNTILGDLFGESSQYMNQGGCIDRNAHFHPEPIPDVLPVGNDLSGYGLIFL